MDGSLIRIGLLDEAEDLAERGVLPDTVDPHAEGAAVTDRRGKDLGPWLLLHRDRFAGDGCLVHGRAAVEDDAVDRDTIPGFDQDDLTWSDLLRRHLEVLTVPLNPRRLRRQLQEFLDRLT